MLWLSNNWEWLAPLAAWVLITICNAVLKHYSDYNGLSRVLRVIIDVLSGLTPSNAPGTLKIPGTKSPAPGMPAPDAATAAGANLVILALVLSLAVSACSGSWYDVARKSLDSANAAVRVSYAAYVDAKTKQCVGLAKTCYLTKADADCKKFQGCRQELFTIGGSVIAFHESVAIARESLDQAKEAAGRWDAQSMKERALSIAQMAIDKANEILRIIQEIIKFGG